MTYTEKQSERHIAENEEAYAEGVEFCADRLVAETDKAIAVPHLYEEDPIWLPKSQIDATEMADEAVCMFVPEWLAGSEDLVGNLETRE